MLDRFKVWVLLGYVLKVKGDIVDVVNVYEKVVDFVCDYGDVYWSLVNMKMYKFSDKMFK